MKCFVGVVMCVCFCDCGDYVIFGGFVCVGFDVFVYEFVGLVDCYVYKIMYDLFNIVINIVDFGEFCGFDFDEWCMGEFC